MASPTPKIKLVFTKGADGKDYDQFGRPRKRTVTTAGVFSSLVPLAHAIKNMRGVEGQKAIAMAQHRQAMENAISSNNPSFVSEWEKKNSLSALLAYAKRLSAAPSLMEEQIPIDELVAVCVSAKRQVRPKSAEDYARHARLLETSGPRLEREFEWLIKTRMANVAREKAGGTVPIKQYEVKERDTANLALVKSWYLNLAKIEADVLAASVLYGDSPEYHKAIGELADAINRDQESGEYDDADESEALVLRDDQNGEDFEDLDQDDEDEEPAYNGGDQSAAALAAPYVPPAQPFSMPSFAGPQTPAAPVSPFAAGPPSPYQPASPASAPPPPQAQPEAAEQTTPAFPYPPSVYPESYAAEEPSMAHDEPSTAQDDDEGYVPGEPLPSKSRPRRAAAPVTFGGKGPAPAKQARAKQTGRPLAQQPASALFTATDPSQAPSAMETQAEIAKFLAGGASGRHQSKPAHGKAK